MNRKIFAGLKNSSVWMQLNALIDENVQQQPQFEHNVEGDAAPLNIVISEQEKYIRNRMLSARRELMQRVHQNQIALSAFRIKVRKFTKEEAARNNQLLESLLSVSMPSECRFVGN